MYQRHTVSCIFSSIAPTWFLPCFCFDFWELLYLTGRHPFPVEVDGISPSVFALWCLFRMRHAAVYLKRPVFMNVQAGGSLIKSTEITCPKMDKLQATSWAGKSPVLWRLWGQLGWLNVQIRELHGLGAVLSKSITNSHSIRTVREGWKFWVTKMGTKQLPTRFL